MSGAIAMLAATARVDTAGLLVGAAPRLLDLLHRAGGAVGTPIAVPEMAALARLAQRLGVAVDRTIVVADGEDDIEFNMRAEPDATGVTLHAVGWQPRAIPHGASEGEIDDLNDADWAWRTDAALRLTYVSAGAVRDRLDTGALLGAPLSELFAPADGEQATPLTDSIGAHARFDTVEGQLRGSGRRVLVSAIPRIDDRGRFAGYEGWVVAPETPNAATAASPSAGFAGELDRALRQPLERIIANAGSMSAGVEGPLADSYASYADDIASAGRHLLGLVTDLIDLEAIERADFAVALEAIDLADVARRAAGLLSVRAGGAGVRIERPAMEDALPATGDFRRALQVLVNLIANALRYSPGGGTVWVRVERDGDHARAIVADQGKGIARDDHALIFDKFGRVDPGEAGGSGLGLYISRRLARAMGGDLIVDSAPGQGARFVFTLPAR